MATEDQVTRGIRLYIVGKDGRLSSRYSSRYTTPDGYRRHNAANWPERRYIAWECPTTQSPTGFTTPENRAVRCLAAIKRGNHFGSREEALALLAAAILAR